MSIISLVGLPVAFLLLVAAFVFHCFEKRRGVPCPKGARHRRLTWPERVLLSLFVGCLIVYGSTKTNSIPRMSSAPGVAATPSSSQGGGVAAAPSPSYRGVAATPSSSQVALKPNQLAARFALARVETNTPWRAEKPEGAHENPNIRLRGAAEDCFDAVSSTNLPWRILFGGEVVDGLTISTTGVLLPKFADEPFVPRSRLADLKLNSPTSTPHSSLFTFHSSLGVLPEGKWDVLGSSNLASRVWWTRTPSNSIVVTWQNVLLNRDPAFPVSFQTELFPNGSFVYRYDLSRLGLSVQSEAFSPTNALVGAFSNGHGETFDLSTLQPFNFSIFPDAFVTLSGYEPMAGDSEHEEDRSRPRRVVRYAVRNGVPVQIAETRFRYQRGHVDGYETVKEEKWRTGVSGESACSYTVTFTDTGPGTPLLMRNAVAESLDEDGILTENAYSLSNDVLVCTSRRSSLPSSQSNNLNNPNNPNNLNNPSIPQSNNPHPLPTYEITESDATYGNVLRRATCLTDGDAVIAEERSTYDEKNRLRSTTYLDGTSFTNAYSCCRLLWRSDTALRRVLRSATTGTDHLYNAEEEVWLADISTNGGYRVTQHFFDGLGRETNTVVCIAHTPGEAVDPDFVSHGVAAAPSPSYRGVAAAPSPSRVLSRSTTDYPSGGSDCSIHTDERGRVTATWKYAYDDCDITIIETRTNDVWVSQETRTAYRNGATVTYRVSDCIVPSTMYLQSTRETRATDYAADGTRFDVVVTATSDHDAVTNSLMRYDALGRRVSVWSPLGATSNIYLNASTRLVSSIFSADGEQPVRTDYLYDAAGERCGTVRNDVTNRTDVAYETIDGATWRVTTQSVSGPRTNAVVVTRERLTGLSDACRSHVIVRAADGAVTETRTAFDPVTGILTETIQSSVSGTTVRRSRCGVLLSTETDGETRCNAHDALGRVVAVTRRIGDEKLPVSETTYTPCGDVASIATHTNGTETVVESYAYNQMGQRIAVTNSCGGVTTTVYDACGSVVEEGGATYPVRYGYDADGRRILMRTTRDGTTWDDTRWIYDFVTGLCTAKIYPDGCRVDYTYTGDGLPLRTTYASGRWFENVYDAERNVVQVLSSDGALDVFCTRDEFGQELWATNAVAAYGYGRTDAGLVTNELSAVGNLTATVSRTYDGSSRLAGLHVSDGTPRQMTYRTDGRLDTVVTPDAVARYVYAPDGADAGYVLTLSNGRVFTRTVVRDVFRRELVTRVENGVDGVASCSFNYAFDAAGRPVMRNDDVFGYNMRGEVAHATISDNQEVHAYDLIGNSLWASFNSATNHYTANNLNQYTSISTLRASVSPCELSLSHDADGNLVSFAPWSFSYDSGSRLTIVTSNGVAVVANAYDHRGRRVRKTTRDATHTFIYDDWNLVLEHVARTDGTTNRIEYVWGKDLSGTLQGAGGVGALLYVKIDGAIHVPFYDAYGNIVQYRAADGSLSAAYTYDAFGHTISQNGPLADLFRHRFSSKYFDVETGLYYYGYRFYSPMLRRWLTRDPIEERGGINLYVFCRNNSAHYFDGDGQAFFAVCVIADTLPKRLIGKVSRLQWVNGFARNNNIEVVHEHLFFQDGKDPSNIGWRNDEKGGRGEYMKNERFDAFYTQRDGGYNDCIMREAVSRVKPTSYNVVKYNCQDYADALRSMYRTLLNDTEVVCRCKKYQ